MQDKSAFRPRSGFQDFEQLSPGFQTMNAYGKITVRSQSQLPRKDCFLKIDIVAVGPPIQPDLSNCGGNLVQKPNQLRSPGWRALLHIPGVIAERWNHLRRSSGQR